MAQDLDPLCAIVESTDFAAGFFSGKDPKEWLDEHDAEQSWVFDMAPVAVAPTKNVVGHVQICRPADDSCLVECARQPAASVLAIEKLFVRPNTHEYGIARYLLKESVAYIRRQGKDPVLDLRANVSLSQEFCAKFGFEEIPSADLSVVPMIYR